MNTRPQLCTSIIAAVAALFFSQLLGAQSPPSPKVAPAIPSTPTTNAAETPPLPAAPIAKGGAVKVGSTMKPSRGLVTDVDKGDNGCYLTVRDEKNSEYIEVGSFAICTQKPPLKGKRVDLEYSMETIMAGDCYGDPKCKRTETVPFITSVKIVE